MMASVATETTRVTPPTPSARLPSTSSTSPSAASGPTPLQNLLHQTRDIGIGALCNSQKAFPSRLIEGNSNRTATEDITNPASETFRKASR